MHDISEKFKDLQTNWEGLAQSDPLWAIITDPARKGGKWNVDEFFATGEIDLHHYLGTCRRLGYEPDPNGTALDFGCGVGRNTLAMARHFRRVEGVDISPTMIALAEKYNKFPDVCNFTVNIRDDLSIFPANHFNFVFSILVLQHMINHYKVKYIREFVRTLQPQGMLFFQTAETVIQSRLPPAPPPAHPPAPEPFNMEMHGILERDVRAAVEGAGAQILHAEASEMGPWLSRVYYVTKSV